MLVIISNLFRYETELQSTRWTSLRQGAVFGLYTGCLYLIIYIVDAVGFTFGSILMYYGDNKTPSISDIIIVSALNYRSEDGY
jgi:H+/Cl- antiporter ClcA